jgi:ABC-type branched-subunit amino acid transport system ATPase component
VKLDPTSRVSDLSFVDRQMVEIARAVSIDPNMTGTPLIILDEPTAVLEQTETAVLEREIRKLKDIDISFTAEPARSLLSLGPMHLAARLWHGAFSALRTMIQAQSR